MCFQELVGSFYSNSSLLLSDLKLLSEKTAFNDMLTIGLLLSDVEIYVVHRYVACCIQTLSKLTLKSFCLYT